MPNWLRALLAIFGVLVLVVVAIGFAAFRWMKVHGTEFAERSKAVVAEGRTFGEGKSANDCVEEGLRRARASSGFMASVNVRVFSSACFRAATVPPDFCSAVPTSIMDSARWASEQCSKRKLGGDQACIGVFQEMTVACERRSGAAR